MILAVKKKLGWGDILGQKLILLQGLSIGELLGAKSDSSGEGRTAVQELRGWLRTTHLLNFQVWCSSLQLEEDRLAPWQLVKKEIWMNLLKIRNWLITPDWGKPQYKPNRILSSFDEFVADSSEDGEVNSSVRLPESFSLSLCLPITIPEAPGKQVMLCQTQTVVMELRLWIASSPQEGKRMPEPTVPT